MSNVTMMEYDTNMKISLMAAMTSGDDYFARDRDIAENKARTGKIASSLLFAVIAAVLFFFMWSEYMTNRAVAAEGRLLLQISGETCRRQCKVATEFIISNSVSLFSLLPV